MLELKLSQILKRYFNPKRQSTGVNSFIIWSKNCGHTQKLMAVTNNKLNLSKHEGKSSKCLAFHLSIKGEAVREYTLNVFLKDSLTVRCSDGVNSSKEPVTGYTAAKIK